MNTMKNVGIAIVTCNRQDFYNKCRESIPEGMDVVTVNDGKEFDPYQRKGDIFIQNKENMGVGKSKNILFKKLLEMGKEHIFIIEDDMLIKKPDVFEKYIMAREATGIQHFMFAYIVGSHSDSIEYYRIVLYHFHIIDTGESTIFI